MALTKEQSEIWRSLNVGPQWVLRDGVDPLAPPMPHSAAAPRVAPPYLGRAPLEPTATRSSLQRVAPPASCDKTLSNEALIRAVKEAPWDAIAGLIEQCRACPMGFTRHKCVFADGAPGCPLVIVGEAPGRDEDREGVPFVGKSGQLLTNILASLGFKRGVDVAIVNVLKCRPPNNRDPLPEEIEACSAFLDRQLELLQPKALVLMGRFAIDRLLGSPLAVGRLRGKTHQLEIGERSVPTIVTYHPSYLLRNPVEKEKSWHDFLAAKALLEGSAP